MMSTFSVDRWDALVSFLEDDVARMSDSDLVTLPDATERVRALRRLLTAKLQGSVGTDPNRTPMRIPSDALGRRNLLRRVLARKTRDLGTASMSFQDPERLSDSDVDSLLRDLLQNDGLEDEETPT